MPGPTLRTLARELGISRTTISEALRGSPRVHAATAKRIRAAAEAAGYHHNPLAGAIMSELRRSRGDLFRGMLALIDIEEPDRPAYAARFHESLTKGAYDRAASLGFKVERFTAGAHALPQQRLDHILQARGIRGVMLLPAWRDPDLLKLDWAKYAGVYLDYHIERPALACVCSDHFRSMMDSLQRLRELGYTRPGVVIPRGLDERLQHRWEGAFLAFQRHHPEPMPIPPLVQDQIDEKSFRTWFKKYNPDVVLSHLAEILPWMRNAGAKLPKTHGFFCLNLAHASTPCAGLDLNPQLIGARAAEILIAQLHRNERGITHQRALTTLPSIWIDGPTLRTKKPAARRPSKPTGQAI